ncbi:double-strand break repair helicase AddA [Parvularcula sp. ZS-1/3]|uniref:DNA 3'-5' helicase n=1 Tax=Parvularcula mediterranea TaxID=2732508 RepID=A0A7Y3RL53_9PROT|nr:double-strand break repair helicase AddA [Parvularcula mediterranea]NNU16096.1 double-strand break repair helicase AddA [Parvularcula mediterranea]
MTTDLEKTNDIQKRVGDPARSAWVSANAGTGKTYILVRRVIRELLAGAEPASIVCITFTKAGAAEMSGRLLEMLSDWTLVPDDKLSKELADITGTVPSADELKDARQLFAKALESPGGLKIQTIHSFCASILSRFPVEAGLPLGFKALEDDEAAAILREAVRDVATWLKTDDGLGAQLDLVTAKLQAAEEDGLGFQPSIEDALTLYAQKTRSLRTLPAEMGDALRSVVGAEFQTEEEVAQGFHSDLRHQYGAFLSSMIGTLDASKAKEGALVEGAKAALESAPTLDLIENSFVLTADQKPRKVANLAGCKLIENFAEQWEGLSDLVLENLAQLRAVRLFDLNYAFSLLARASIQHYNQLKEERLGLDYDDLIEKTLDLLGRVENAWVQYKLDAAIDHVLLDEAQDTSASQWELVKKLSEELTATSEDAAGTHRYRSLFVVGDPKQSIYAFNGAEARLFNQTHEEYETRMGGRLADGRLFLSFRTAQPVLDAVDAIFHTDGFREAGGPYTEHKSAKPERPGSVALWPHLPEEEKADVDVWAPVDAPSEGSIDRRLARAIAADIKARMERGDRLACKDGRVLQPKDVMILFQRRGPRFEEMLKALVDAGIPSAGTDRIAIARDTAVRDLIALLRLAANRDDSLSLAVLLKSPFFGWSEDRLYDLCQDADGGLLWRALRDDPAQDAQEAFSELSRVLDTGARHGPYRMLAAMLDGGGELTGRQRLGARLGDSYAEAVETFLDEALSFEDREPRSLHGFLRYAENFSRDIKRETAGEEVTGVRVMTVHGAKGLEAPLVYVADADYLKKPHDVRKRAMFVYPEPEGHDAPLPVLVTGSVKTDPPALTPASEDAEQLRLEEYQRLFYVAATRAEEHLVIAGGKAPKDSGEPPPTWHAMAMSGMDRLGADGSVVSEEVEGLGTVQLYAKGGTMPEAEASSDQGAERIASPQWLSEPVRPEDPGRVIYPSLIGALEEDERGEAEEASPSSSNARLRGVLLHRLLEVLPEVPPAERKTHASALVQRQGQGLERAELPGIVDAALGVLADDSFAPLFGEGSMAEVSIQGQVDGVTFSGQIDRLLMTDSEIVAVEYKSSRWIPATADAVPSAHRKQMEAYLALLTQMEPSRPVRGILLYTAGPRVIEVG